MNQISNNSATGQEPNKVRLLTKRNMVALLLAGLIGMLGGGIFALMQKKNYQSRLTFALDEGSTQSSGISMIASQFGLGGEFGDNGLFSGDNILEVMKSRRIFEAVMLSADTFDGKNITLIERYRETLNKKKGKEGMNVEYFSVNSDPARLTYRQDSLLSKIYLDWNMDILKAEKPNRKYSIYEVNITLPDEQLAKVATDRVIEKTMTFYTEIKTAKSKSILQTLEDRVASMKGNFSSSVQSLASAKDANLNPAMTQTIVPTMKAQTNIQVYSAAYGELFKNLEIARFQYMKETPLLQIIDAPKYPLKVVRLSLLKGMIIGGASALALLFLLLVLGREFFRKKETIITT